MHKHFCDRCGADLNKTVHTMSMFNTDHICLACKSKEQAHPDYEKAREAETAAVRQGNMNFPGIGKPADL
jgi:hypothetical protein